MKAASQWVRLAFLKAGPAQAELALVLLCVLFIEGTWWSPAAVVGSCKCVCFGFVSQVWCIPHTGQSSIPLQIDWACSSSHSGGRVGHLCGVTLPEWHWCSCYAPRGKHRWSLAATITHTTRWLAWPQPMCCQRHRRWVLACIDTWWEWLELFNQICGDCL